MKLIEYIRDKITNHSRQETSLLYNVMSVHIPVDDTLGIGAMVEADVEKLWRDDGTTRRI